MIFSGAHHFKGCFALWKYNFLRAATALLFVAAFFFTPDFTFAQNARLLTLEHPALVPLMRLQQRGALPELHPQLQPWDYGTVTKALAAAKKRSTTPADLFWIDQAEKMLQKTAQNETGVSVQTGMQQASFQRYDVMRPAFRSREIAPDAWLQVYFASGNFAAQAGAHASRLFDTDPDGIDVSRRLFARSEGNYLTWRGAAFAATWGRFHENWSEPGLPGVILTPNAAAFDHVSLHFGNKHWKVSSLLGELDMLAPDGTFTSPDRFQQGGIRRWVAMHRLEWHPQPGFMIGLFEGVLYSSATSGLSLAYAHPGTLFGLETDNEPKNHENNLLFGVTARASHKKWTAGFQIVFDDGVVENRKQLNDSGALEPISFAAVYHLYKADVLPGWDLKFVVHHVSNLAYRTDQMEGQWTYAQRGLASNFSDFKHEQLALLWHTPSVKGLTLSPYLARLRQGEGDFRLPLANDGNNSGNPPRFFQGTVTKTFRTGLEVTWTPTAQLLCSIDAGLNRVENRYHLAGRDGVVPAAMWKISWRLLP